MHTSPSRIDSLQRARPRLPSRSVGAKLARLANAARHALKNARFVDEAHAPVWPVLTDYPYRTAQRYVD